MPEFPSSTGCPTNHALDANKRGHIYPIPSSSATCVGGFGFFHCRSWEEKKGEEKGRGGGDESCHRRIGMPCQFKLASTAARGRARGRVGINFSHAKHDMGPGLMERTDFIPHRTNVQEQLHALPGRHFQFKERFSHAFP